MTRMEKPIVTLCLDEAGIDALYVNGKLAIGLNETLYAADVLEALQELGLLSFETKNTDLGDRNWPDKEDDVPIFIEET